MFETYALRDCLARPISSESGWRVLATIISTEGSTYRGPGAKLVIDAEGQMTGVISGGCFDSALFEFARDCHEGQHWREVMFDLRNEDDAIFGIGLGCQGMIRLLMEPLPLVLNEADIDLLVGRPRASTAESVAIKFLPGQPVLREYVPADYDKGTKSRLLGEGFFLDIRYPRPRLIVIGCGADTIPIVRFADALGWRIWLVDHREAHLNRGEFSQVCRRVCKRPGEFFAEEELFSDDAILVMSHNFMVDLEAVSALTATKAKYVGVLGPSKRGQKLRAAVEEDQSVDPAFWRKLYNPVGLDIGSENSEEIALSAIAEINAVLFGKKQQHLCLHKEGISHD